MARSLTTRVAVRENEPNQRLVLPHARGRGEQAVVRNLTPSWQQRRRPVQPETYLQRGRLGFSASAASA